MRDEAFVVKHLEHCARCHQDHDNLYFWPLTHPVEDPDGTQWTLWTPCPTNGEPILLRMSTTVTATVITDTPPMNVAVKYGDPGELKPRC